jgi:sulfur carrier protein ThiS
MTSLNSGTDILADESSFTELRRKVRSAEILSAAVERLLRSVHFSGKLTVVIQNGQVLKSGYEEGYFTNRAREPHPLAE